MGSNIGGQAALGLDETKVYIVRKKPDGYRYKVFHDGREERLTAEEEQQAAAHAAAQAAQAAQAAKEQ
jgi:hypothetical protein